MPFTLSFDGASAELEAFLRGRSYVFGFSATQADVQLFNTIGKAPDAAKFPHTARYYNHIASFAADARGKWPAVGAKAAAPAPAPKAAAKAAAPAPKAEEEDDAADLFGDDDAAEAKVKAKAAAADADKPKDDGKKKKKVVIDKSAVIYEVKPAEVKETDEENKADIQAIVDGIKAIEMEGLVWGKEFKIIPVAYGIKKIIAQAIVEDEKVSLYDLEELLAKCSPLIGSVDQTSMSKIS